MGLHLCSELVSLPQAYPQLYPREPWEQAGRQCSLVSGLAVALGEQSGTQSQMRWQRVPQASFGLVMMSGTTGVPIYYCTYSPLFRNSSRGPDVG